MTLLAHVKATSMQIYSVYLSNSQAVIRQQAPSNVGKGLRPQEKSCFFGTFAWSDVMIIMLLKVKW